MPAEPLPTPVLPRRRVEAILPFSVPAPRRATPPDVPARPSDDRWPALLEPPADDLPDPERQLRRRDHERRLDAEQRGR